MADNFESELAKADALQEESKFAELTKFLKDLLVVHPDHVEFLWRLARSLYQEGAEHSDAQVQKSLYQEAYDVAQKLIKVAPDHWSGYKWAGITTSALNDFTGAKERIAAAYDIKEYMTKAEQRAPDDATTKFALGKWCFTVSSIGWVERNAASLLLATPPESTFEEALNYFKQAEVLTAKDPAKYKTTLCQTYAMLGKTYQALKKPTEAAEYHQKCIDSTAYTSSDKKYVDEAKAALSTKSSWW